MYKIEVVENTKNHRGQVFHGNINIDGQDLVFLSVEEAQEFIDDHLEFMNEFESFIIIEVQENGD